ncbi:MAG: hypothetical protein WEE64_10580 [Dehalococcoidia bacterium]
MSAAAVILAAAACSDEQGGNSEATPTVPAVTDQKSAPGVEGRVTLSGTLTLDDQPLDAEFRGARVIRDGLPAACQSTIYPVVRGRYEVEVASDAEVRGCGAPGAEIVLWAFANDAYVFSQQTVPWPGSGAAATFDASFSSTAPQGASLPVTEFKGHLFDRDGSALPSGTAVEAYIGEVRCGVTSLRYGEDVERFYTLIIAGPESISGCTEGARLTFRLDGEAAADTAVNDLKGGSEGHELDLTVQ